MKKIHPLLFFIGIVFCGFSQETAKDAMERKQLALDSLDIVTRFDSDLAITPDQLRARKEANKKKREQFLLLIENSELKERQKERLRHDVMHNPFSARLQNFISDIKSQRVSKIATLATIDE